MNNLLNLRSFLKFLSKNWFYTFVEVFGLSVSLMFVILIAVYTYQELSVDRFHEKGDRLYMLTSEECFGSAQKLGEHLKDRYPEIEDATSLCSWFKKIPVTSSTQKSNADLLFVESNFFDLFSFPLLRGDREQALVTRSSAVISESFANRLFSDRDPVGQVIEINDEVSVIVVAIMQDIHNSAIPYGDILLRIENATSWHGNILSDTYLDYASVAVAFLAKEGADLKAKESEILNFFRENVWIYSDGLWSDLSFIPLKEVYFHKTNGSNDHLVVQGDKTFVLILLSIGILILVFAVINYVNLTVAQAGFRAKEMSTRRLLGSSREELFSRLMMESTLLCILSFGVGLLLVFAFLPFADNLLEARINLKSVFIPRSFILIIVSLLLIGGLAGFLPAFVISNAKPIEVVKGIFRRDTKMVFSKFFITFQNIITIALATASLVMIFQVDHLIKAPLGYNTVNILDVEVGELNDKELTRTLKGEFERLAAVRRIGFNQGLPFGRGGNYTMKHENKMIQFQSLVGDSTFFNIMGFEILRENHVGTSHAFYLSEQAFRELGIPDDAATFPLTPFWNEPQLIAGKVKDFQLSNIMFEKRPILLRKMRVDDFYPTHLAIEVAGDPFVAYQDIKEIYEQITELEFPGTYVSQQIEESFNQQRKTSRMVIVFTGIAILLSILGLIAMCTYFIQQRSLEVAVRKVFGCSNPEILITLVTTFLSYVVIAFFIVTPFIWYIMEQWLSDYSYRISLSPWIFISSGLFCLITSFITVFWQSYQAANTNPVHMIKTE